MRIGLLIATTVLCASCTVTGTKPARPMVPMVPRTPQQVVQTKVVHPAPGSLNPDEIVQDDVKSRAAATQYVVSAKAEPAKIHRLATLTAGATRAVRTMEASRSSGKLEPAEIRDARSSVDELRFYLADDIGE